MRADGWRVAGAARADVDRRPSRPSPRPWCVEPEPPPAPASGPPSAVPWPNCCPVAPWPASPARGRHRPGRRQAPAGQGIVQARVASVTAAAAAAVLVVTAGARPLPVSRATIRTGPRSSGCSRTVITCTPSARPASVRKLTRQLAGDRRLRRGRGGGGGRGGGRRLPPPKHRKPLVRRPPGARRSSAPPRGLPRRPPWWWSRSAAPGRAATSVVPVVVDAAAGRTALSSVAEPSVWPRPGRDGLGGDGTRESTPGAAPVVVAKAEPASTLAGDPPAGAAPLTAGWPAAVSGRSASDRRSDRRSSGRGGGGRRHNGRCRSDGRERCRDRLSHGSRVDRRRPVILELLRRSRVGGFGGLGRLVRAVGVGGRVARLGLPQVRSELTARLLAAPGPLAGAGGLRRRQGRQRGARAGVDRHARLVHQLSIRDSTRRT